MSVHAVVLGYSGAFGWDWYNGSVPVIPHDDFPLDTSTSA